MYTSIHVHTYTRMHVIFIRIHVVCTYTGMVGDVFVHTHTHVCMRKQAHTPVHINVDEACMQLCICQHTGANHGVSCLAFD